jgi:hypothetical protein
MTDIGIDSQALTEFLVLEPSAQADVGRYSVASHTVYQWRMEVHALQHVDPASKTVMRLISVVPELDLGNYDTRSLDTMQYMDL